MDENPEASAKFNAMREALKRPGGLKAIAEMRLAEQRLANSHAVPQQSERRGRKPANLPSMNGVPRYVVEKAIGLRRATGAMKLKRLTHRHYKIIGLHLEGKSLEQISLALHVSYSTISLVLNDPLSQGILKRVYSHREEEIHALGGKAIEATRDALTGEYPIGVKLRAVDRFIKIRETMLNKEQGRESAEDVIARMLRGATVMGDINVQVNNQVAVPDLTATIEELP